MDYTKLSKTEINRHLLWWSMITAFSSIFDPIKGGVFIQIIGTLLIMFRYMLAYYALSLFVFPKFYKINVKMLLLSFTSVYVSYEIVNYVTFHYVMPKFGAVNIYANTPFFRWILTSSIFFLILTIMAFGAYQNRASKLVIQTQNERDKILLTAELGFFRNQFNSHITFNFLNYCYSHVHKSSSEAKEAIELFSDMLRYTLRSKPNEYVRLKAEVEYINQFISLQRKLGSEIYVEFNIEGDINAKFILPRILIGFVENAFKHGITYSNENPVLIHLSSYADMIKFKVVNQKNYHNKTQSTNVGHHNIKQQLNLSYRDKHTLNISEDEKLYTCELILNI